MKEFTVNMTLAGFLLATGLSAIAAATADQPLEISVFYDKDSEQYVVLDKVDDQKADAYGYYYKNFNGTGWNYLDVFMQQEVDSVEDHLSFSEAMGYAEGYITCPEIQIFYPNFYSATFGTSAVGARTLAFMKDNYDWLHEQALKYSSTDDYWYAMLSTIKQLNGLFEGYVAGCGSSSKSPTGGYDSSTNKFATLDDPTLMHFLLINGWGDIYQIAMKFKEPGMEARHRGNRIKLSAAEAIKSESWTLVERCSAIIKLLPDLSDVVYGHATWDSYESLGPRIFKHYNFPLMRSGFAEHHYDVYFSSSPALLTSMDDFYTVSGYAQMGVMETSNNLYNQSLLELVVPQSSLSWERIAVSNQLAETGADWADNFARYHSGTYINQWMILDLKLFDAGTGKLPAYGFLTVLEEVPGLIHTEDQTEALINDGYWASYNIPFYDDISVLSGYAALCALDSSRCHDTAPRSYLFAEYQDQITDIEGGQWILRYNSFQNDSASLNDSCDAIACRGDLEPNPVKRGAFGALDAKVTTAVSSKRYPGNAPYIVAALGPSAEQQPVFCWSQLEDEAEYSHAGQPDCFDYGWAALPPKNA